MRRALPLLIDGTYASHFPSLALAWWRTYLLTGMQELGLSQSPPNPDRNRNSTKPSTPIPSIHAPRLRRNIIERPHAYPHTAPNSCNPLSLLSANLQSAQNPLLAAVGAGCRRA